MRLLQREAEDAYAEAMGLAADQVFRRVRGHLTREERRAFRLMYLPNPWLDGRVAVVEPLAWSFALEMDEETQRLLLGVLVRKAADEKDQTELKCRWQAFLRFYPHWLDMVRDDEREARRQRRDRKRGGVSAEHVKDSREKKSDMASHFHMVQDGQLFVWVARYCTGTEAEYVLAYFRDGQTEPEIAARKGVRQQAVNKSIQKGLRRLRAGLVRDKLIGLEDGAVTSLLTPEVHS
jgi:hypothetical protein